MKAMYLAFLAIIVIGVGAGLFLNLTGPTTGDVYEASYSVRVGDDNIAAD